ncbi:MAG: alpha-E domain-containing protein [Leptospiraceae bacterium]|nr:alpha-E domain-containing protein [Leptospiraceae bacterium]MDW8306662.1 alpha-E domain-containing protein [Leptospiraceae bacterium]
MLSRVANSIYWMTRYVERAENYARLMHVNFNVMLDALPGLKQQWEPLVDTTGDREIFLNLYGHFSRDNVIKFMTFDVRNRNSILSCLETARENARSIRENISTELWEHINEFYLFVKGIFQSNQWPFIDLISFFNAVRKNSHMFFGIMEGTLSHSESWHFARTGLFLERSDKTARILDMKYYILLPSVQEVGMSLDLLQWNAILKSASAHEMFYKKYRQLTPLNIADFLILDREFPRAIYYCVRQAREHVGRISGSHTWDRYTNDAEKKIGTLCSELEYRSIQEIFSAGLHEYLDHIQRELNLCDDAIYETFFAAKEY